MINIRQKNHPFILIINILIFSSLLLLQYTDNIEIKISTASVLLILPSLTAFSLFHSPLVSSLAGLFCGIFMDACAARVYCFNSIILICICCFVSLSSSSFFNKNIPSAAVLSLITCSLYFVAEWIVFHTKIENFNDSLIYLLIYALPSAVLSSIFIFPFYFLYKHFHKISLE